MEDVPLSTERSRGTTELLRGAPDIRGRAPTGTRDAAARRAREIGTQGARKAGARGVMSIPRQADARKHRRSPLRSDAVRGAGGASGPICELVQSASYTNARGGALDFSCSAHAASRRRSGGEASCALTAWAKSAATNCDTTG